MFELFIAATEEIRKSEKQAGMVDYEERDRKGCDVSVSCEQRACGYFRDGAGVFAGG